MILYDPLHEKDLPLNGGYSMTQTPDLAKEILKDLITIERSLWENNAEIYHDRYSPEALLIFPGVGRIEAP